MSDYNANIECKMPIDDVYKTITQDMSKWWTSMSSDFLKVGDRARTDFGGEAYWVFEAKKLHLPSLIELECVEANYIHPDMTADMREEWITTTLRFEIEQNEKSTLVNFTHIGLVPDMGCYDVCKGGWDHFILSSLKNYLDGKPGKPNSY